MIQRREKESKAFPRVAREESARAFVESERAAAPCQAVSADLRISFQAALTPARALQDRTGPLGIEPSGWIDAFPSQRLWLCAWATALCGDGQDRRASLTAAVALRVGDRLLAGGKDREYAGETGDFDNRVDMITERGQG